MESRRPDLGRRLRGRQRWSWFVTLERDGPRAVDADIDVCSRTWSMSWPSGPRHGKTAATGYQVNTGGGGVVLWDAAARRRLTDEPLLMPEGYVYALAFSPDGQTLAAGFRRGAVLWDIASHSRLIEKPLVAPGEVCAPLDQPG